MRSRILLILIVCAIGALIACSGGQSGTSTNNNGTSFSSAKPSTVQVTIGDDPADRVASLSLTVNSITLVTDSGTQASLLSAPATVEISSLAGTTTPLATTSVPAGTYTKAVIALGGATIMVVDPSTGVTVQKTFAAPSASFTITLNPAYVSDGTASVVNVNLDLHKSVGVDSTGTLTFNPFLLVAHAAMNGPAAGHPPDPMTGGIDHVLGKVTAVNAPNFTITTAVGQRSLTFATNSSTVFKNISGISSLQNGMLVMVGGQAQSDGSLLALGVAVMNGIPNATGAVGIVAKTTGTPVTQFTLVAQGLTSATALGTQPVPNAAITVNVSSGTAFRIDSDNVDLSGLNPTFDASTLSPAQAVEVDSAAPVSTMGAGGSIFGMLPLLGTFNATQVQLEQQPLRGTISNLATNTFTLTV
ncbi:MAG: DUF4382 domain-containing protein, partial [Terriglobales bacterium]